MRPALCLPSSHFHSRLARSHAPFLCSNVVYVYIILSLATHALARSHSPFLGSCAVPAFLSFSLFLVLFSLARDTHARTCSYAPLHSSCAVHAPFSFSLYLFLFYLASATHALARTHAVFFVHAMCILFSLSLFLFLLPLLQIPTPEHVPMPFSLVVTCVPFFFFLSSPTHALARSHAPFFCSQQPKPWHVPILHFSFIHYAYFFSTIHALARSHAPFLSSIPMPSQVPMPLFLMFFLLSLPTLWGVPIHPFLCMRCACFFSLSFHYLFSFASPTNAMARSHTVSPFTIYALVRPCLPCLCSCATEP